ncbi:MAG: RluA family pseudouridine synthase [Bacteroidota bacterium]
MSSKKHIHRGKPQFLNKLAPQLFPELASKAKARKAISAGELTVNGQRVHPDARVVAGDEISLKGLSAKGTQTQAGASRRVYDLEVAVLYEDDHIAAVHKPGGIPVNGVQLKTLENALPKNLAPTRETDALEYLMPLHRLDAPTTGLVLIAKTNRAQVIMGQRFQQKEVNKRYQAVVIGELPQAQGEVNEPIDRKPSTSRYEVVETVPSATYGSLSLVKLYPVTGRTHQLRIHMAHLGCPIVGDKQYSGEMEVLAGKGLMLCADEVSFHHPITEEPLTITTEVPRKFIKYMEWESRARNGRR